MESQLLLSTQPPICLDPSTDVVYVTNRLNYNQKKYNSQSVQRYLHRRSHAARKCRSMDASEEPSSCLKLLDIIKKNSLNWNRSSRKVRFSLYRRYKGVIRISVGGAQDEEGRGGGGGGEARRERERSSCKMTCGILEMVCLY